MFRDITFSDNARTTRSKVGEFVSVGLLNDSGGKGKKFVASLNMFRSTGSNAGLYLTGFVVSFNKTSYTSSEYNRYCITNINLNDERFYVSNNYPNQSGLTSYTY